MAFANKTFTWTTPDGGYKNAIGNTVNIQSYLLNTDNGNVLTVIEGNSSLNSYQYKHIEELADGMNHTFKIAACRANNGTRVGPYSNIVNLNLEYYTIVSGLSLEQVQNNVVLTWTNPSLTFTPKFKIQRINHYPYPGTTLENQTSVSDFEYLDNAFGTEEWQDAVDYIDAFGSTYDYAVAIYDTVEPFTYRYTSFVTINVENFDVPNELTILYGTDGNNALALWENPVGGYTETIESFALNRVNPAGHPNGSSQVFTFNDDGSATYYVNTNIGLYAGTYGFQLAACRDEDGFNAIAYTYPVIYKYIYNNSSDPLPKVYFTGDYNMTKYYGSHIWSPEVAVNASTSGAGTAELEWEVTYDGYPGLTTQIEQSLGYNADNFETNLTGYSSARADSISYTWNAELLEGLTYEVGVGSHVLTTTLPEKVSPLLLSVTNDDDDHIISWVRIPTATDDAVHYGYWLQFYPEGEAIAHEEYLIVDSAESGTAAYTKHGQGTAGYNTTYAIYGASNSTFSSLYISQASNTITSVPDDTPPSAPTANCVSTRTTETATLSWSNTGGTGYKIYVRDYWDNTVIYNNTDVGNVTSYIVTVPEENSIIYKYQVIAYNGAGDSSYSNEINFNIVPATPSTPTVSSFNSSSIAINWDDIPFVGTYRAQRSLSSDMSSPTESTDLVNSNYTFTSLSSGTTYYMRVKGRSNQPSPCGGTIDSAWSEIISQTTA